MDSNLVKVKVTMILTAIPMAKVTVIKMARAKEKVTVKVKAKG